MEIRCGELKKQIKEIVEEKAKYQKVMVLFDDSVSNLFLREIYEQIKDMCIYNQYSLLKVENEVYDGYKLLIYVCEVQSFLNSNIRKEEFVNIFIPQDDYMLPYFLNDKLTLDKNENFLIIESYKFDVCMLSSVYFNKFYHALLALYKDQKLNQYTNFITHIITSQNIIEELKSVDENSFFVDVDIAKKQNIKYENLMIVDLLIVDSILLFLSIVNNEKLMMVDLYKETKGNEDLIDKFYKLYYDRKFINTIKLNHNFLYNYCLRTKQQIMQLIELTKLNKDEIEDLICKIKEYSKFDKDIMAYLYLYNIFSD